MESQEFHNFEEFLKKHTIKKDNTLELTHTEIGKTIKRRFHIPSNEYETYMKLYNKDVIKKKQVHNIIERQLIHKDANSGPLLCDMDLQFSLDYTNRQYKTEHIDSVFDMTLGLFSEIFDIDEDTKFVVAALEKPAPRVVTKSNGSSIVKDGIHFVFAISMNIIYHQYIRSQIIEKVKTMGLWENLPTLNEYDDIFDSAITNGSNGWLPPFSQKPDDTHYYNVTQAYEVNYDVDRNKWNKMPLVTKPEHLDAFYAQHYKNLFIRNENLPKLLLENDLISDKIQKFRDKNKKPSQNINIQKAGNTSNTLFGEESDEYQISIDTIRQIRNIDDVNALVTQFLDNLPLNKHELREAYEYAMSLPSCYYLPGSYNKWIKVGFGLRNTSVYLLIAWVKFSVQDPSYNYHTGISQLCDFWIGFNHHPEGGVTKSSLMYWSKHDAPDKYQKIYENTVDYYLDQTINNLTLEQLSKGKTKNSSSDYDIASIVFQVKKDEFVACGIKSNAWCHYNGVRWSKDDSGTSLRNILSTEIRGLYLNKSRKMLEKAFMIKTPDGEVDVENEDHILHKARANLLVNVATRLGNTHDKDCIMRECRELFYDKDFEQKLDQNRYLLCFLNGVFDFKQKKFRKGYPEDYLSKCTNTDYIPHNPIKDKVFIDEIKEYFNKIFPIQELCNYAWDHMASVLIGDTAKTQCLHYYTGEGQNGKSMLIKFLQEILGDYTTELDVSFFVNDRPTRGRATPELLSLVGARLAITSEPSEGEKLNEGPMKQLTSGTDKISYRGLFKDQESFIPQVHPIIMANHYLPIKSRDHGTWRRIRVLKFLSRFSDTPDPNEPYQFKKEDNFDDKFGQWGAIFTSMLIEIACKNQGSLPLSEIIKQYSQEYRKAQDYIGEFIEENLMVGTPNDFTNKTVITTIFNEWCMRTQGGKVPNKTKELYKSIEKHFNITTEKAKGYRGICIQRETHGLPCENITDSESETASTVTIHNQ
jgi:P4 family phage/plasmid primase-like protien